MRVEPKLFVSQDVPINRANLEETPLDKVFLHNALPIVNLHVFERLVVLLKLRDGALRNLSSFERRDHSPIPTEEEHNPAQTSCGHHDRHVSEDLRRLVLSDDLVGGSIPQLLRAHDETHLVQRPDVLEHKDRLLDMSKNIAIANLIYQPRLAFRRVPVHMVGILPPIVGRPRGSKERPRNAIVARVAP